MILGDVCTRRCGFCNVQTGKPSWNDPLEPLRVANQVKAMGLRHAVVTSVDRDDLPDYGASAFVGVVRSIRMLAPDCKVEILTPDFRGQEMPLAKVIHEKPDVFNHNVETVPRLYPIARRGSQFARSARVLRMAKEMGGDDVVTKSGLMVGLGESFEEMVETFGLLREHRVQVLTVGQYLRPTENHLPVVRYWHPDEFEALEKAAYDLGFESVAAGPLVRSSYHADQNLPDGKRAESLLAPSAPRRGGRGAGRRRDGAVVRPMELDEVDVRIDYFHDASDEYLLQLGVDRSRCRAQEAWRAFYEEDFARPLAERETYNLAWELDGRFVGFSSADHIDFGEQAFMHLHIVEEPKRRSRPRDRVRPPVGRRVLPGAGAAAALLPAERLQRRAEPDPAAGRLPLRLHRRDGSRASSTSPSRSPAGCWSAPGPPASGGRAPACSDRATRQRTWNVPSRR